MENFENCRIDLKLLYNLANVGHLGIIKWCMMKRLLPKEYKCPKCGRGMKLSGRKDIHDGYAWTCQVYGENYHSVRRSIRCNTWFIDSRLNIIDVLLISYFWIKKATHQYVMDELGVTHRTVSEWFFHCQQLCIEMCVLESEVLGGEGVIVEIYETQYVQLKKLRYKGVSGNWLIIGVEKNTNKYFFRICETKNKQALLSVIEDWISPGSILISDFWKAHNCFSDEQFECLKISKNFTFQQPNKKHSSLNIFSLVKNLSGSCSNDVFLMHVAEFLWRRSHKNNVRSLIESFFMNLTKIFPPQDSDYME